MNKKALGWALVMMTLSLASNLLFPSFGMVDSSIFYFLGVALNGVITYFIVVKFFPGKCREKAASGIDSNVPKENDKSLGSKIVILFGVVLLVLSVSLNIFLLRKKKHIPYVNSTARDGVTWFNENWMSFSGVVTFSTHPEENWTRGYQLYQGEIERNYSTGVLECNITSTVVYDGIVTIENPMKFRKSDCKILNFDGAAKKAQLEGRGTTFSVNADTVMWQDKSDAGVLVSLIPFVLKIAPYN